MTYRFPLLWMLWISLRPLWFARREEARVFRLENLAAEAVNTAYNTGFLSVIRTSRPNGDPLEHDFRPLLYRELSRREEERRKDRYAHLKQMEKAEMEQRMKTQQYTAMLNQRAQAQDPGQVIPVSGLNLGLGRGPF